jgi:hypothetical protein
MVGLHAGLKNGEPSALAMPGELESRDSHDAILAMEVAILLECSFREKSSNLEKINALPRLVEMP